MAEKSNAELQAENARLKEALDAAKQSGTLSPVVEGTFTAEVTGADGKTTKRKFGFKNGRVRTPLRFADVGRPVPSSQLMALANGTAPDKIEGLVPELEGVDKATAQRELEYLVLINASTIEAR